MRSKLVTNSAVYVLLGFLAPAVNFILVPVYTQHLDKPDYALITLAMLVQTVLTPLMNFGMIGSYSRYFFDFLGDDRALARLLSTTLIFYILMGILYFGIGMAAGSWIFDVSFSNNVFTFSKYGYYILFTTLAINIQILILGYYRNLEMSGKYALWSILFFLSAATAIYIGVAILDMKADGSIKGRMWGTVLTLVPLFIFFFSKRAFVFDWKLCKMMLPYALPLVPYLLLNVAFTNFDKALVEQNFSLNQLGEYGFAILIASVIEIFINAIQAAINPQLFRLLGQQDASKDDQIFNIFRFSFIVNMFIIAGLISFSGIALHLFIDPLYWDIMDYFPLLCLIYLPRINFTIWGIPMMYYKKTKYLPFVNLTSLLSGISIALLLIDYIGIYALPIALFSVQLIQNILSYAVNQKLRMQLPAYKKMSREYILMFVLFLTTIISCYLYNTSIHDVVVYIPVIVIFSILLLVLYRQNLKQILSRKTVNAA